MKIAKIFQNGSSQAVRLPKECRFDGKEVLIRRFENLVILCPKNNPWKKFLGSIDMFTDDYLEERNQPSEDSHISLE